MAYLLIVGCLIFFEYAYDTARLAKEAGLANVIVTNGFMTKEALETIADYLDACNVDLKSFNNEFYKTGCQGRLKPVLNSIRTMKDLGIWVEVTTLIIPDKNDSDEEFQRIAGFISGVSPDLPWHIICPSCQHTLIRRSGFSAFKNRVSDSRCPECGATIPGVFS